MEVKSKKIQSSSMTSQIQITVSVNSKVDFNSHAIKVQLNKVKNEVKAVLEGAHIDAKKLSLSFTV